MKLQKLVAAAALSSTVLMAGAPVFAQSEVQTVDTQGEITFTPNSDEPTQVIPTEPDGPEVEIPPVVGPDGTNYGPLTIAYAPTMNFGEQNISNQDQTYSMIAEMQNVLGADAENPEQVPYVSFAQVQDTRGSNEGWDLQVRLTDFTSNTQNNVLTGAQISLIDPRIQFEGNNVLNAPVAHTSGLVLNPNAGAVSLMTAEDEHGAGASSVVWGDQAALMSRFTDDEFDAEEDVVENTAIELFVPGSTAKDATTYTSTLTWELTTTPGSDGETPPETP